MLWYCVFHECVKFITVLVYYFLLLAPNIADVTILYSHKVLKTFNCHLNHKHKITKMLTHSFLIGHTEVRNSTLFYVASLGSYKES